MKHIVLIESNTTGTGAIAVRRLLAQHHRVTFLTGTRSKYPFLSELQPQLRLMEIDTNDVALLLQELTVMQEREGIDALLTSSEFYVLAVAEIAAALGLPGLDPWVARACRHKPTTRRVLAEAGLLTPEYHLILSDEQARDLANQISYPCVLKPPCDSSSHGVRLVRDPIEALTQFHTLHSWSTNVRGQALDGSVLAETFLEGPEFSVETFTTRDGVTHVVGVTDKHLSEAPHFVETGHDFPSRADRAITESLSATVLRGLEAVGYNFGPAHTEIRLTPQGPAIIEINPRLAGGMIPELVKYATGIDLLQAWISLLLGEKVDLTPTRRHCASIRFLTAARSGSLVEASGISKALLMPSVREVRVTACPGARVRSPEDAYDRIGFVIASGPVYSKVHCDLEDALQKVQIRVEDTPELLSMCVR
jgi:S-sulfo-L-cysteine synthase (3-phospho-L-serine-dependent)